MTVDATQLGQAAAKLMEKLEATYPDGSELREVLILAEVEVPADDDEEPSYSAFDYWCTSKRAVVRAGMAEMAREYFVEVEQPGDVE